MADKLFNTETLTFDRAAIARRARDRFNGYPDFMRCPELYRSILAEAWHEAKTAKWAHEFDPAAKADRLARIRSELASLTYKTLRYDTARMRRDLQTQIDALAA